ncbi:hypothetical protein HRI_000029900 [Hibiscus trionum]|uniref:RRM domain-containing protein n=1 Tax=Hibiscus trionum TaxID=183268 RepID=A0A9W7LGU6_HIBTR|nr:hypothetical protein HRI_000029900 [Hibiscus trionum]
MDQFKVMEDKRGKVRVYRRLRFSLFIDNVSKRIHPSTLREAFWAYGTVVDVFVAYYNPKRRGKPTTFAFIRFSSLGEAMSAIAKSNGRLMDDFRIKISTAKQKNLNLGVGEGKMAPFVNRFWKLKDSRSFKEALLGVSRSDQKFSDGKVQGENYGDPVPKANETITPPSPSGRELGRSMLPINDTVIGAIKFHFVINT